MDRSVEGIYGAWRAHPEHVELFDNCSWVCRSRRVLITLRFLETIACIVVVTHVLYVMYVVYYRNVFLAFLRLLFTKIGVQSTGVVVV